jgi:hypothetical protein
VGRLLHWMPEVFPEPVTALETKVQHGIVPRSSRAMWKHSRREALHGMSVGMHSGLSKSISAPRLGYFQDRHRIRQNLLRLRLSLLVKMLNLKPAPVFGWYGSWVEKAQTKEDSHSEYISDGCFFLLVAQSYKACLQLVLEPAE